MQSEAIDRRELREFMEKQRKYWATGIANEPSTGAIADTVLKFLAERGIKVKDSDWS
jgi:hypothetical protein